MIWDKKIKALEILEQAKKNKEVANKEIDDFMHAYRSGNQFECAKKLGVLEYIKVPDVGYYEGITYKLVRNYDAAIRALRRIPTTSKYYDASMASMLEIYRDTGNYFELNKILKSGFLKGDVIGETQTKLLCLGNAESTWVKEHACEIKADIIQVSRIRQNSNEFKDMYFLVCYMFAELLLAAGLEINQIAIYKNVMGNSVENIEFDENLVLERTLYEKWCIMLSLAQNIKGIKFAEENMSLEKCALVDRSWEDKVKEFQNINYQKKIAKIIVQLLDWKVHSFVDKKKCLNCTLSLVEKIQPEFCAEIISHNQDVVKAAYLSGDEEMIMHVNYVDGVIGATGNDPFQLKGFFKSFVNDCSYIHEIRKTYSLAKRLSKKAYFAWESAERSFIALSDEEKVVRDFSTLALQYFKIIEIIYTEKLLIPLAVTVGEDDLNTKKKSRCKFWDKDKNSLMKIKTGKKDSMELGTTRVLLERVRIYSLEENEFANMLKGYIVELLSIEGQDAFGNGEMENVISSDILQLYRVPGAHTGIRPFSIAQKSREYVLEKIPLILSWFK